MTASTSEVELLEHRKSPRVARKGRRSWGVDCTTQADAEAPDIIGRQVGEIKN